MSSGRHRRVTEVFLEACELAREARGPFLASACGDDAELRREVEEMLGVDETGVPALATRAWAPADERTEETRAEDAQRLLAVQRLVERAAARAYEVRGELARGGMGAVLCVHDPALRRDLAMKVSLRQLQGASSAHAPGSAAELARFLEEAQITAQLDHPGIVPVHDLGVDAEGRLYFTMKLVQGRELGEVLRAAHVREDGWTTTRAVGILRQVCEAMAYAHDKGVVHRDLKAANVMVGEYGEVYVMDWGVARTGAAHGGALAPVTTERGRALEPGLPLEPGADDSALHTRAGAIVGSPHAMAPEQARGEPAGPAADVYAVGAMLYRLLSGRRPYERAGEEAPATVVVARILAAPPAPLRALAPDAPAELVAIAERAMAPRPEQRYADMRALADDLRAYLEGRVVRAHRTGALAELAKWVARNRLAAAGIAATLAALVGGLLWGLWLEAANRRELDLASDSFRARVLVDSADELWPAAPATIPAFEDWLARAGALLARRDAHAERLGRFEAGAGPDSLEAGRQRALLAHLDALEGAGAEGAGTAAGLVASVRARLAFASTIEGRSRTGAEVAALWREAAESIRAGDTQPAYAGLELAPQLGLVPLGPDPASGLWEFAHLETGETPRRDSDGVLTPRPEHGLVFVLVPGGTFRMGASRRAGEPNYDPSALPNELPALEVTLAPFFLSKYELTQAQWLRRAGRNPSKWPAGSHASVTALNPVEQVSWSEAAEVLARMGLVLPTEARWEYACRAGTDTPFHCDSADLALFMNVGDQRYRATFADVFDVEPFDDGFGYHAPVGSLEPNAFGLHDMHGNVFELTLDSYGSYLHARRPGDGLSLGPSPSSASIWWSSESRVGRGGLFELPSRYARASTRVNIAPAFLNHGLGVRPAREIEGAEAGE